MKFQLYSSSKSNHAGYASGAVWLSADLVATCGDDKRLLFWSTTAHHEPTRVVQLPIDAFPTSMHYLPGGTATMSSGIDAGSRTDATSSGLIAIGATNGHFYLISPNWNGTRLDKDFEAHQGAVIVIRWSNDHSTLATAGEDGLVKIWSRAGMLRSTIPVSGLPVYAMSWSPDSNSLVYANSVNLVHKSLSPQSKTLEWIAHDGLVIALDWSATNGLILSAAEDGRVKVWDATSRLIYVSSHHSSELTAVAWAPSGDAFAVATFNSLKLHDQTGTCLAVEKLSTEGIANLAWSADSNQICAVCSNGQVLFSYLVDRVLESSVWQVTNSSRRSLKVTNVSNALNEVLEFRDAIAKVAFGFEHLVVVTASQCFVYSVHNLATPHYFDLKSADIALIAQSHRHFLLLGLALANLYTYDGRLIKTLKLINLRGDSIRPSTISLNDYTLAYKDGINLQTIYFVDIDSVKPGARQSEQSNSHRHLLEVIDLKLSNERKQSRQVCAFLDKNSDLYFLLVSNNTRTTLRVVKLSPMVRDYRWHEEYNILVSLHENRNLSLWLYPATVFFDATLLSEIVLNLVNDSITANNHIGEFGSNQVLIRRQDGVKIHISVNPFVTLVHQHRVADKWNEAVRVCNFVDKTFTEVDPIEKNVRNALWASLAVMSLEAKEFQVAEIAYAAINKLDKVLYLNRIKQLPNQEIISAELELMCGNFTGSESILLQKGFIVKAILLNLNLHRWSRALELARNYNSKFSAIRISELSIKPKTSELDSSQVIDSINLLHIVLSCRQHHLTTKEKQEIIKEFKELDNEIGHVIEWTAIEPTIMQDKYLYSKI